MYSYLKVTDQVSHPYKLSAENYRFVCFILWVLRQKLGSSELKDSKHVLNVTCTIVQF